MPVEDMASPKIKRLPRGRSRELAHYLTKCGIPETPPRPERIVLEDAATRTRRALRSALRRAGKIKDWSGQHADDLARLCAAVPEPMRERALVAVRAGRLPDGGGLAHVLAVALLARNRCTDAHLRLAVEYALGVDPRSDAISHLPGADLIQECMAAVMHTAEVYDRWRKRPVHSSFANAAAWWLRHFAEKALREQGHDFRPPGAALSSRTRVLRELDRIEGQTGERPTAEALHLATARPALPARGNRPAKKAQPGKPVRVCRQVLEWASGSCTFASADRVIKSGGGDIGSPWIELQPTPEPDPADERGREISDAVGLAVESLPAAQRDAIRAVHGIGCDPMSPREYALRSDLPRKIVAALVTAAEDALRARLRPALTA